MREVTRLPGVSAEEVVSVVRVHLDRVHDVVRRLGCDPRAAVEVVETSALDLVDAVAQRPETVSDAVGWWFAHAAALAGRVIRSAPPTDDALPMGGGLLAADEDQVVLAEALEELPERERAALLLRDSYDLPAASVAAALSTDVEAAMELVGRARLAFLPLADDEPAPPVPGHAGRVSTLARLGEGGPATPPEPVPDPVVRRHTRSCPECRAVVDAQERAHLLLGGLTVAALPSADHAAILERVDNHSFNSLPSDSSLFVYEEDEEWEQAPDRALSPLLVALSLLLAAVAGVGLGVLLDRLDSPGLDSRTAAANVLPPVTPPPALSPEPFAVVSRSPAPQPTTRVFLVPSPTTPPPSPTPATDATLAVDPQSGPDGATLTVTGTGWTPDATVQLDYLDPSGQPTGTSITATTDASGAFSAQLTARNPEGTTGRHTVRASDGRRSRTAAYEVTG